MLDPMTYMQAMMGFAVLAGALSLVPGLDMMMTLNESIHYGRRNGIAASLGIQCGVLVWAVAAAAGLAALIAAFPLAYDAIRVVGGLYLLYLGWTMSGAAAWARRMLRRVFAGLTDGGRADAAVAAAVPPHDGVSRSVAQTAARDGVRPMAAEASASGETRDGEEVRIAVKAGMMPQPIRSEVAANAATGTASVMRPSASAAAAGAPSPAETPRTEPADGGGTSMSVSAVATPLAVASTPSLLSSWWRGFLTNLLNPKIGVFYVAVIPQFLVPGVSNLLMGASLGMVHVLEGSVVLLVVACAAAYFAGKLSSSRGKTVLSLVSGAIMAVLGGATLFEVVRERMA